MSTNSLLRTKLNVVMMVLSVLTLVLIVFAYFRRRNG